MSIMSYNGGAVMAMRGKNCVAIAADRRFGIQAQMVTTDFQKIFPMGERLYIGLAGLATDVQTVAQRLKFRLNLYELKEGRQIKPQTFMSMVSNLLYERRFGPYYTEPVIAGLDPITHEPFICSLDLIGCPMITEDFVVSGTCSEQMYGMCESLWEPDMVSEAARFCLDPGVLPPAVRWGSRERVGWTVLSLCDPEKEGCSSQQPAGKCLQHLDDVLRWVGSKIWWFNIQFLNKLKQLLFFRNLITSLKRSHKPC
uniref:Proteasome subunit beta n=1 Tax=Coturnix japonica TaxID=93934 RepID=A0A8C2SQ68_COTJA